MKPDHKAKIFRTLFLLLILMASKNIFAFNKYIGYGYCATRHPIESVLSKRASCESQHVIQQQSGGDDNTNTIWINTTQHTYLDRSVCKPWENERPSFTFLSDANIERAYMMGTWALGYHYFMYDHHGEGRATLTLWDGSTHLIYIVSSVINFPQKEINYIAYQIERFKKNQETQIADAALGVFLDLIELSIGVAYSATGVIIGTILNPLDTMRNIPSLITLLLGTFTNSIWHFFKGLVALFTLGSYGSCGI